MNFPFPPEQVAAALLAWYGRHGRELPWRQTRDPYRIWLSEIMLQQTTVGAVIPYYEKFLAVFPDVESLAAAPLEAVLELWSGLGYYSRARNLHAAARAVVNELGGTFPETAEELLSLPGIGRSTAGAIVSIAYDRPAPILDGNVRRVLVRLMALRQPPREKSAEKKLWQWAEALTPIDRPHDYAQAIMDLGATLCTPRQPDCPNCPLNELCLARRENLQNELPLGNRKAAIPTRHQVILLITAEEGQLLLFRRPPQGLLGGMWEFPCAELQEGEAPGQALRRLMAAFPVGKATSIGRIRHLYSHFRLEAEVYRATPEANAAFAEPDAFWHDAGRLKSSPLHGAHQKALKLYQKEETDD